MNLVMKYKGYGILVLGLVFSACHTRQISPARNTISSPVPMNNLNPGLRNSQNGNPEIPNPKAGNTHYQDFVNEYISTYSHLAIQEMHQYGVPASIILAQGIHESGAGRSSLALQANNHFGVKCTSDWIGQGYYQNDDKPNECFRKYASAEESFQDHMNFLLRKRYTYLFSFGSKNYTSWAYGLKACGYATNPKYPEVLIGLIERYNLSRFDDASSKPGTISGNPVVSPLNLPGTQTVQNFSKPRITVYDTIHKKVYKVDTIYSYTYSNKPPVGNHPFTVKSGSPSIIQDSSQYQAPVGNASEGSVGTRISIPNLYIVRQGDTFYSICRRFQISQDQLKAWNNLPDTQIKIDQVLKIKP